jgi:hypothetical protein
MKGATYLYCIVKSAAAPSLARVPAGVAGATRPALVPLARSLRLVVAEVPLDVYGPGPLEASLRDMAWVSDVALAHEAVVEHFARVRGATVVPMALLTMFSSLDRAVKDVSGRMANIGAVLRRVEGCAEWGVRVTRSTPPPAPAGRPARPTSGSAFLAARKQARDDARAFAMAAAEAAEDAFDVLAPLARDARRRTSEPAGAVAPPLLDVAFLVRATAVTRFKAAARRAAAQCARAGSEMTLSGPWPPYNFVQLEERE